MLSLVTRGEVLLLDRITSGELFWLDRVTRVEPPRLERVTRGELVVQVVNKNVLQNPLFRDSRSFKF